MNINLKLKIPLINDTDPSDSKTILLSSQLMLTPLFALESDVISPFIMLEENQLPWVRQLLFSASLTVYRLSKFLEKLNFISKEDLFLLRRDFVICIVTNEMSKQMNKDLASAISRAKSLGDFSVSTSKKGDSVVLMKLIQDSGNCVEEMKALLLDLEQSSILPASFVKGRYNSKTTFSSRLWWLSELPVNITDGFASKKYWYNGRGYKGGTFNLDSYSKYSNYKTIDYYRALSDGV